MGSETVCRNRGVFLGVCCEHAPRGRGLQEGPAAGGCGRPRRSGVAVGGVRAQGGVAARRGQVKGLVCWLVVGGGRLVVRPAVADDTLLPRDLVPWGHAGALWGAEGARSCRRGQTREPCGDAPATLQGCLCRHSTAYPCSLRPQQLSAPLGSWGFCGWVRPGQRSRPVAAAWPVAARGRRHLLLPACTQGPHQVGARPHAADLSLLCLVVPPLRGQRAPTTSSTDRDRDGGWRGGRGRPGEQPCGILPTGGVRLL